MALIYYDTMQSPFGEILLTSNGTALTGLYISDQSRRTAARKSTYNPEPFKEAIRQLKEYFTGIRSTFDLPLSLEGTDFQKRVWKELQKIGFAETKSYADVAKKISNPKAVRAVGTANGRNPISIIVPCHRVINTGGRLGGYGGGIKVKEWLLRHEAEVAGRSAKKVA